MSSQQSWLRDTRTLGTALVLIVLLILSFQLSYKWTRMLHIVAGFVWYAMLVFLVIIFLPVVDRFSDTTVYEIVGHIVPRIFHTVTVAGFFAVGLGWFNALTLANGNHASYFTRTWTDTLFTFSIVVVTLMYCFHLFLESSEINVSSKVAAGEVDMASDEYQTLIKGLKVTPRVGFLIISFAIFVMFLHQ